MHAPGTGRRRRQTHTDAHHAPTRLGGSRPAQAASVSRSLSRVRARRTAPHRWRSSCSKSKRMALSKRTAGSPFGTEWRASSCTRRSPSCASREIVSWSRKRSGESGARTAGVGAGGHCTDRAASTGADAADSTTSGPALFGRGDGAGIFRTIVTTSGFGASSATSSSTSRFVLCVARASSVAALSRVKTSAAANRRQRHPAVLQQSQHLGTPAREPRCFDAAVGRVLRQAQRLRAVGEHRRIALAEIEPPAVDFR